MSTAARRIPPPRPGRLDVPGIIETFAHRMMYSVAKNEYTASDFDVYQGLAYAVRDRLMERWFKTQDTYYRADAKRAYYMSLEFLTGRALVHNVINLGADDVYTRALEQIGYELEAIEEQEWDAGLGNGGLGRLAACILDSAATLGLPFYGYGIRYEYGIFQQHIQDGQQVEAPDSWLRYGNPWEIPRPDALFPVRFYGRTNHWRDEKGHHRVSWVDTTDIYAMAYDTPVLGHRNDTVNSLRLWAAKASREFDLSQFNAGEYARAVEEKTRTENISKVLYPPDDQYAGKELRLKQQYFFVTATLQDVVRRFKKRPRWQWEELPDKVAVQLNDTHPALAIPELMRVLVDQELQDWDFSWELTKKVFGYTNHTILPEALEKWPEELMRRLLPRHMEILDEIDRRHRAFVAGRFPGDHGCVQRTAVIEGGQVRMGNLAVIGSAHVNGVARLHTEILKAHAFRDFHALWPDKISNKTNGITPRRWLLQCNPGLSALVSEAAGHDWPRELDRLRKLTPFADDAGFRERWAAVKAVNKVELARWARKAHGFELDPTFIFDVQVKRIHEYKRQLLNALHVVHLWQRIQDGAPPAAPRVVIFAGKAAPGYVTAKLIIRFIHAVADLVNRDAKASKHLRVAFLPNYSVSLAERIFPACELSEQISTAGTEASGTGNMKAALNGALTMGTLDGANVEIAEEVGRDNIFIFGHTTQEVEEIRRGGYDPGAWIAKSPALQAVLRLMESGPLAKDGIFEPLVRALRHDDRYLLAADFEHYVAAQEKAAAAYLRPADWNRMSILNSAGMGKFSSDRTVAEYAAEIWGVKGHRVELDDLPPHERRKG
jgi:glycogen phosphorylase